ncbi:MAG: lysine--tRNA ligase [archaeon]|nr:lysine--tRNA ligase [archaeon]MCR4323361.1 lysine--tRNA ligase [Nanoarchaeota archaeon]
MATGREKQIIDERIKKIEALRKEGINPYPQIFEKKHWTGELQKKYSTLKNEGTSKDEIVTAGRLMTRRSMGKISFGTIQDNEGQIQILLQSGETPEKAVDIFKTTDAGDFVGIMGNPIRTKRGELSILVKELILLSKSIKPLPEKWHGLKDKEERYRKRYLDLIMNEDVRKVFETRAKIIFTLRKFLEEENFMEVETPLIQAVYGGASAKPFTTHINALDMNAYLAISPELYLKRLIVGGYERVYTICKNFRNEGIDFTHNPEFTMMEYYAAYKNYEYHIDFIQRFFDKLRKELKLGDSIDYRGKKISLKTPFKKITFRDLILNSTKIDINKVDNFEKLKKAIKESKINLDISECKHYGSLLDEMYKRIVRPGIIQPTILTHYPVEMIALAKRNEEDPSKINSVQLIIDGAEIIKAYDELNDPIDQDERFKEQQKLLEKGDEDAMPMDEDFVNALMHGMPPTAGFGMGIDRLTMLFTGKDSIRDVIFFPFMKPEQDGTNNKE